MSVTAASGFSAAGVACGIKPDGLDLAIVVSDRAATAAGVFTRNQAAAAPVLLSRQHLAAGTGVRAVVINSGCANAATGDLGAKNARTMAESTASALETNPEAVLVCSTGTIGPQLPMGAVRSGIGHAIAAASSDASAGDAAATAIHTTDTMVKQSTFEGEGWTIGGMAKGAGMVRPDMATMLAVITTDAAVDGRTLGDSLADAVDRSFNSLNIDGCESTNDAVIVLASGASASHPDSEVFVKGLRAVCADLAEQMARDAEGASRVVTIDVGGAADDETARSIGRRIADSALVRASFYGGDVNWGRIVGALGTAPTRIDFRAVTVGYQGVTVFADGVEARFDEDALLAACVEGDLEVTVTIGDGPGSAHILTTDLTPEYVVFNGERS